MARRPGLLGAVALVAVVALVATVAAVTTRGTRASGESVDTPRQVADAPATGSAGVDRPSAAGPLLRLPNVDLARLSAGDIPPRVRQAYTVAADRMAQRSPGCHLHWWLLAAIGYVESDHGAAGGSKRADWDGMARPPILGPPLDGTRGYPRITDTDHGFFDGSKRWDRAIGPMQFLPSSWVRWGGRGPLAGHADPQNLYDAALAAGSYLCADAANLSMRQPMAAAVFSYNPSPGYVRLVLSVAAVYAGLAPSALGVKGVHARPGSRPGAASGPQPQRAPAVTPSPSSTTSGGQPSPKPSPSSSSSPPLPLPSITRPAG